MHSAYSRNLCTAGSYPYIAAHRQPHTLHSTLLFEVSRFHVSILSLLHDCFFLLGFGSSHFSHIISDGISFFTFSRGSTGRTDLLSVSSINQLTHLTLTPHLAPPLLKSDEVCGNLKAVSVMAVVGIPPMERLTRTSRVLLPLPTELSRMWHKRSDLLGRDWFSW